MLLLQVRTLFVSGLPMDTKPRELYLLFRAYEVRRDRKVATLMDFLTNKFISLAIDTSIT